MAQAAGPNDDMWSKMMKFLSVFFFVNYVMKPMMQPSSNTTQSIVIEDGAIATIDDPVYKDMNYLSNKVLGTTEELLVPMFATHDSLGRELPKHTSLYTEAAIFNLQIFLSTNRELDFFDLNTKPIYTVHNIPFNWTGYTKDMYKELSINITTPPELIANRTSYYAHIYFSASNYLDDSYDLESPESIQRLDPEHPDYDEKLSFSKIIELIKYKKNPKKVNKKKLLETQSGGEDKDDVSDNEDQLVLSYWKPSLLVGLVLGVPPQFARNQVPPLILQHMNFLNKNGTFFYPIIYHNDFWILSNHMIQINETTPFLPLIIKYSPISMWTWSMQTQFDVQTKMNFKTGAGGGDKENDTFKEILLDTNPWLLALTVAVSMLHMLFDMLAFKNDIQFWRKKKSMVGTSTRSLLVNAFFQTIILLYLFDNDTSTMILFSSTIGLGIEYWKVAKAFKIKINLRNGISRLIEFPTEEEHKQDEEAESDTSTYDKEATTHLLYVVLPLVVGYSVHALIHQSYKSFYSWIISSLVGFVYAFGFVLMTPQLYINYKMKSVAHMPWKAMVYKSLNTFIDDLFAFVIKMPFLHRLACFRDDIIFFIYLYQRWIYPIDFSRTNEYGQEAPDELQAKSDTSSLTENVSSLLDAGGDKYNEKIAEALPSDSLLNDIDE